jgi:hypothetical protein
MHSSLSPALSVALLIACAGPAVAQHAGHSGHEGHHPSSPAGKTPPKQQAPHRHQSPPAQMPPETKRQWDLLTRSVQRYRDFSVAEREGWKRFGGDSPMMGEHWYLPDAPDPKPGDPLDFTRPSNLQYAIIGGQRVLVGVSFVVRIGSNDPLPEGFAGDADHWHVHDAEKAIAAATEERPVLRWLANGWIDSEFHSKGDFRGRLAMVHAWVTVPSPEGPFSMHNRAIPYLRTGLPWSYAQRSDEAAANGVNLAAADGCKETLDGQLWIADAGWRQSYRLHQRCEALAERMRATIRNRADAEEINRVGRLLWNELETFKRATLSERQLARIASITEHDPMH